MAANARRTRASLSLFTASLQPPQSNQAAEIQALPARLLVDEIYLGF
jgi:hypothetical protein